MLDSGFVNAEFLKQLERVRDALNIVLLNSVPMRDMSDEEREKFNQEHPDTIIVFGDYEIRKRK